MKRDTKILMVEDSQSLATVYRTYLEQDGYKIATATSLAQAHASIGAFMPDIVLLDIELPDGSGMDFMDDIQQMNRPPEVIVMTAHGTSDMALEAIRKGARDFLTKPFDGARLRVTIDNVLDKLELGAKVQELSAQEREQFEGFIGKSPAMQSVYRTITSIASSGATAFIQGESGTGKELAAEAIHRQSERSKGEFVAINCAAIPRELMESELFGHVKGAFTGASNSREGAASFANGGTLFLDEICEMDLDLQSKLLRFIQTGTLKKVGSNTVESVDVRFVCATNRDPVEEVRAGRFREDLFYRLHVIPIRMPALRERGEDTLMLAEYFLKKFADMEGKHFKEFSSSAHDAIMHYAWPGNIRELQNVVQQAVVLNDGDIIEENMLSASVVSGDLLTPQATIKDTITEFRPTFASEPPDRSKGSDENNLMRRREITPLWLVEKQTVMSAIDACGGNINHAAGLLEVAPSTIYRKLQLWERAQS